MEDRTDESVTSHIKDGVSVFHRNNTMNTDVAIVNKDCS